MEIILSLFNSITYESINGFLKIYIEGKEDNVKGLKKRSITYFRICLFFVLLVRG